MLIDIDGSVPRVFMVTKSTEKTTKALSCAASTIDYYPVK